MAVVLTHTTQATGANDPAKQISKDAWNAAHTISGLGDAAEKNTGTAAGTVAAGDHLHTGVYEPAGVSAADITDSTVTGRSVLTAADAAAARTAIGAGTSNVAAHSDLTGIGTNTHVQIDSHIASTSNPHSTTAAQVGLGSVTNDAQTKAAVVPNTVPSAGQILVGNAGGTAYAPVSLGTDATLASTGALTIANNAITYAKMQDVSATSRFIGRITAAAGDPEELTGTQATTLLDAFTSLLKGLVPASGGGTTNFLRADGTFAAPTASTPEVLQSTKEPAANVTVAANFSVFSDEETVIGDGFEFLLETNASLVII